MKKADLAALRALTVPIALLEDRLRERGRLRYLYFDLLFQSLFLIFLLTFLALQAQVSTRIESIGGLQNALSSVPFPSSPSSQEYLTFPQIRTQQQWEQWLVNVVNPFVRNPGFYQILNCTLRTVRVQGTPSTCPVLPKTFPLPPNSPPTMPPLCSPPYSSQTQWTTDSAYEQANGMPFSQTSLDGEFTGNLAVYPSSGYLRQVQDLEEWYPAVHSSLVDANTRLMSVSVVAHHMNFDTFVYAGFFAEFGAMGLVIGSSTFVADDLSGLPVVEVVFASLTGVVIILFILFRFYSFCYLVQAFILGDRVRGGKMREHILSVWFIVDVVLIVFGIIELTYISLYYWSSNATNAVQVQLNTGASDQLADSLRGFQYYQEIFSYTLILYAILVFRYCAAIRFFDKVDRSWNLVYGDWMFALALLMFALVAFALAGTIAFTDVGFESFVSSMSTVLQIYYGEPLTRAILLGYSPSSAFSYFFMLAFHILISFCLYALLLAIIIEAFKTVSMGYPDGLSNAWVWSFAVNCRCIRDEQKPQLELLASEDEIIARLERWREKGRNAECSEVTWEQVKTALKGDLCDDFAVADKDVDALFQLVGVENLRARALRADAQQSKTAGKIIAKLLDIRYQNAIFVDSVMGELEVAKQKQNSLLES